MMMLNVTRNASRALSCSQSGAGSVTSLVKKVRVKNYDYSGIEHLWIVGYWQMYGEMSRRLCIGQGQTLEEVSCHVNLF